MSVCRESIFHCRERSSLDKSTRFLLVAKTMQALSFFLLMSNAASQFCSPWTLPCRNLGSIDTINNFFLNSTKLFLSSGEKNPKLPCVRAGVSSLSHFPCCNDYERGGQATGLATSVLASLVFCAPPIACCEPASATFYL